MRHLSFGILQTRLLQESYLSWIFSAMELSLCSSLLISTFVILCVLVTHKLLLRRSIYKDSIYTQKCIPESPFILGIYFVKQLLRFWSHMWLCSLTQTMWLFSLICYPLFLRVISFGHRIELRHIILYIHLFPFFENIVSRCILLAWSYLVLAHFMMSFSRLFVPRIRYYVLFRFISRSVFVYSCFYVFFLIRWI